MDDRWGMDRLFALVDSELHLDPRSGFEYPNIEEDQTPVKSR